MFKAKAFITGDITYETGDIIEDTDSKLDFNDLLDRDLIEEVKTKNKLKKDTLEEVSIEDDVSIKQDEENKSSEVLEVQVLKSKEKKVKTKAKNSKK